MTRLAPGVDTEAFHPGAGGAGGQGAARAGQPAGGRLRVPHGAPQGPGHADPGLAAGAAPRAPGAGPASGGQTARTGTGSSGWQRRLGVDGSVMFTGAPCPWPTCPAYYDAGNVFAMPCRTRRRGLDVEGLGIVYLEASATGLPVVGGDSGNAPDAIRAGETGYVVPGRDRAGRRRPADTPAHRPGGRTGHGGEGHGLGGPGVALGAHRPASSRGSVARASPPDLAARADPGAARRIPGTRRSRSRAPRFGREVLARPRSGAP